MLVKYEDFTLAVKDITGGNKKYVSSEYLQEGKYPIIDQGEKFIGGFINDDEIVKRDKDVVIFGDHTKILKYVNFDFCLGADGVKVLQPNEYLESKFLYYFLHTIKLPNVGYSRHFKFLKENKIPLPPLSTQKEIAEKLDKADVLRKKDQELLAQYDELAQAIFIDMFGDPIQNERGWEVEKLNVVAPFKKYDGKINETNNKFWLLNLDMVVSHTGEIINKYWVERSEINNSTITFNEEQVLYSKLRPYLNKVVLPDISGYATSELVPLNPRKDKLNRYFLCHLLRSSYFVKYIEEKVAGAKMPRVNMDTLRDYKVILPPISLQNQFAEKIKNIEEQKTLAKKQAQESEDLFQALLQESFNFNS